MEEKTVFLPPKESPPVQPLRSRCLDLLLKFRSKHILSVEPVLFLFMFGTVLQSALFQQYAYNRYGREMFREELNYTGQFNFCMNADVVDDYLGNGSSKLVTQKASYLSLAYGVTGQLPGIVAALVFGPLSDRIGRRPLMVVISSAGIVNAALTLALMYSNWQLEILPAINAINGLVGGLPGMLTVVFAYIADITSKRWLTLRLGIVEAMIFTGGALAVLINGQWLNASNCSFTGPIYLYLTSSTVIIIYTIVWLPGSLTAAQRKERIRNVSFCSVATRGLKLFFIKEYSRWTLWLCGLAMFNVYFLAIGVSEINTLFLLGPPLSWDPGRIGLYQALTQAMFGVGLFTLLPVLVALKAPDPLVMLLGLIWAAVMSTAIGFVQVTWQMFLVGVLSGIEVIGFPPIRSIMSKAVAPKDQGALFSVVAAVQVLSSVCATLLFFFLLPWFTIDLGWPAGHVFFFIAILCVLTWPFAIVFLVVWTIKWYRRRLAVRENRADSVDGEHDKLTVSTPIASNALYYGSTSRETSPQAEAGRNTPTDKKIINS